VAVNAVVMVMTVKKEKKAKAKVSTRIVNECTEKVITNLQPSRNIYMREIYAS